MKKTSFLGRYKSFFLVALLTGAIFSCKENDKDVPKPKTVTDIILENDDFSIFREIVKFSEMDDALRSENLTVFAPNDAAFRSSDIPNAGVINTDKDSAMAFVQHHILAPIPNKKKQAYAYSELPQGDVKTLDGSVINIGANTQTDTTLKINEAFVILKNVNAANGYIHVIDRTLTKKR